MCILVYLTFYFILYNVYFQFCWFLFFSQCTILLNQRLNKC